MAVEPMAAGGELGRRAEQHRPSCADSLGIEARRLAHQGLTHGDIAAALKLHPDFVAAALRAQR